MQREVVITGIGVVSPNGIGAPSYLEALLAGKSGLRRISLFEAGSLDCRIAGEVSLDGGSFSRKEERNLPRVAQFAILASREAFASSGLDPANLPKEERYRFGAVLGTGGGSVEFMEKHYQMYYGKRPLDPSVYVISASTPGGLSSELSIRFGLLGLSHVITTGCTSSTDALGYAANEIRRGRLDVALAGGADAPIAEGIMQGFLLMRIVPTKWNDAPEKGSRPFSRDREGFVLSEGSWMFVLEEKGRALARGAKIYGEIAGYGSSCEAFHPVSLQYDGTANLRAISLAAEEAGIAPEEIDHVNLHGTSTQLNDEIETRAMKQFFGRRAYGIPMNSTKAMIGHPQGASGAAGLAATLLTMEAGMIHPTINLDDPDPRCDLDYVPNSAREADVRYALCNTLGFGSKCSALLVKRGGA